MKTAGKTNHREKLDDRELPDQKKEVNSSSYLL